MPVRLQGPGWACACCQSAGRAGPREESAGQVREASRAADSEQRPEKRAGAEDAGRTKRKVPERGRGPEGRQLWESTGYQQPFQQGWAPRPQAGRLTRDQLRGKRGPITKEIVCHHRERAVPGDQRGTVRAGTGCSYSCREKGGRGQQSRGSQATPGGQTDGQGQGAGGEGTAGWRARPLAGRAPAWPLAWHLS